MSYWSEYYVDRIGRSYMRYCNKRYAEFINAILNRLNNKTRSVYKIREEGCGIATFSKILASMYYPHAYFTCFDNDLDQCFNAKANLGSIPNVLVTKDDILRIATRRPIVDMIFSHGVLEHFDYSDIKKILSRQRKEAKHVIHYVPTDGYDEPSFGDERLLPVDWWVTNFEPTEHIVFNDGKDLVLIWE